MKDMLNKPLSQKQIILTALAAAAVLALVTNGAEAADLCRHGGAWWDWTCNR